MTEFRIPALAATLVAAVIITPAITGHGATPTMTSAAMQQGELSDAIVHKVGTVLRQTATIRKKYAVHAQTANATEQQLLAQQAAAEVGKAVLDQGLTLQQYNDVIQMAQTDPALNQWILAVARSGN